MNKKEIMEIEDKILNPLAIINLKCKGDDDVKEQVDRIFKYIRSLKEEK